MNIDSVLLPAFYKFNIEKYKGLIRDDEVFNCKFRNVNSLPRRFKRGLEWKYIKTYRKYQANIGTIWEFIYKYKLTKLSEKSGIDFEFNPFIGRRLIIGHWGKIVINGTVKFGNEVFVTHGVTIGRDIRGKRAGVPIIGNRVCIRTNSTVVGKITIGDDVLIAPNTFVNFDIPDHSIVIGNPATIHHRINATKGHLPS